MVGEREGCEDGRMRLDEEEGGSLIWSSRGRTEKAEKRSAVVGKVSVAVKAKRRPLVE